MCGITALSRVHERSSINDPRSFMRLAALAIEDRGRHATGFGWTRRTMKDPSDPMTWYWKKKGAAREVVGEAPLESNTAVAIGHTRYKTQGSADDNRNNHPVVDEGIVLVHNGIIHNDTQLYAGIDEFYVPKADVDSQVLATLLANAHEFYAEHPVDLLKLVEGDAALAWLDTSDRGALHLARLVGRPLTIGWTRRGDLVMSSTPESLSNLSQWANVRIRHIESMPEGWYGRVVDGEIVEERTFTPKRRYCNNNAWRTPAPYAAQAGSRPNVTTMAPPPHSERLALVPSQADDDDAEDHTLEALLKRDAEHVDRLFYGETESWQDEDLVVGEVIDGHEYADPYTGRDPFADMWAEGPDGGWENDPMWGGDRPWDITNEEWNELLDRAMGKEE